MCSARLGDGPLVCVRGDHPESPRSHVFHGTSVDDGKHDDRTEGQ